MEQENARKVYRQWWSPWLTLPTLGLIMYLHPGQELICDCRPWYLGCCDWITAERITMTIGVLVSALWHLILLKQARNEESFFVRWHGRQALALAGLRTVIPLVLGIIYGFNPLFIPIVVLIWLIGNSWGQRQAKQGDCSLARWLGHGDELPGPEEDDNQVVESLMFIIRFNHDQEKRTKALEKLKELGMVEDL